MSPATPLAGLAALYGCGAVRLSRRDRADDQDDPPLRSQPARRAAGRGSAARALADNHVHRRIAAERYRRALVLDGPMTGAAFRAYVEQALAPVLQPGDVVVMDNLAAHKMAGIEEAIAATGASLLYLPPYSPDLNPIEQFFAKLKALLRKAATRTKETLWQTAGQLLDLVPPLECKSYLANAGYEPT